MNKNSPPRQLTVIATGLGLLLGGGAAQAAMGVGNTYTVTTTADSNDGACTVALCSLRDAINAADSDGTGPTINFSASIAGSTIVLTGPLPGIYGSMTIDGTNRNITVSGAGSYQVMTIFTGTVVINALTIANGNCVECSGAGIGVYPTKASAPSVTVSNSTFYGNSASTGGAVYSLFPLSIANSTFYQNASTDGGGGAVEIDGSTLTVTDSTFSSNTSNLPDPSNVAGSAILVTDGATATLANTILAAEVPPAANPGNCQSLVEGSMFTDGGGNLSDDPHNTCNFTTASSQYNVPDTGAGGLNLGGLAANGGGAETIALLANSAAISSAPACAAPGTDERGAARPPANCSSGAYQFGAAPAGTTGTTAGCTAPANCNLSGGETQTVVAGTPAAAAALASLMGNNASITENVCIIQQDPRAICGAVPGITPHYTTNTTFPVKQFCGASYGNTVVPDYMCGAYSSSGPQVPPAAPNNGLAVLQGIANGVNAIPGLLWLNDANPDVFFGFSPNGDLYASECSSSPYPTGEPVNPVTGIPNGITIGWAPWSGAAVEGRIPENPNAEELLDGCGGQPHPQSGLSVSLIGVTLNLANATQELGPGAANNSPSLNLIEFAEFKYVNLLLEAVADNVPLSNKAKLLAIIGQSGLFLAAGNHACAETTLYDADNYVLQNASAFQGNSVDPDSYGRTRSRILNLFYTVFTRLDGKNNPIMTNPMTAYLDIGTPLLAGPAFVPPVCNQPHL
ncbi:MAG: CSLREA domain-containing protein [Gammaproteobacteria bacterium]|nr:CSLREA domain-containing protein [Gammaproteobacteria bacterium]